MRLKIRTLFTRPSDCPRILDNKRDNLGAVITRNEKSGPAGRCAGSARTEVTKEDIDELRRPTHYRRIC